MFVAYFDDLTTIEQDQIDRSITGNGSQFTDVLAKKGLIGFELRHVDNIQTVFVDLKTGTFLVNGTPLAVHNQYFDPTKYELELVYFREMRAEQVVGVDGEEVSSRHFTNRYFIGWKTTVNGKEKQVTIAVG
jgi:hypothetical protein